MVKYTKADVVKEFDRELVCIDPTKNKDDLNPQWISQSMHLVSRELKNGGTIEGLPEEAASRIAFFGQWVETERYFTGEFIKEARDLLCREEVLDTVFRLMKANVEAGHVNPRDYFEKEDD